MSRTWRKTEISYLKRYGGTKTPDELAQRFDTDATAVLKKLRELGVAPKDGWPESAADPALPAYEKALKALHREKWQEARKLLEKVLATCDQMEVAARARQLLRVCQSHLEEVSEGDADPYLRAVVLKNRGRLAEAMKIAEKAGDKDERFLYLAASIHALEQRTEAAEEALRRAVQLNPRNRVHAFHDPDFSVLRDDEEYAHLFGLP